MNCKFSAGPKLARLEYSNVTKFLPGFSNFSILPFSAITVANIQAEIGFLFALKSRAWNNQHNIKFLQLLMLIFF